ncbi:hypothetical protein F2P81_024350 [Scophthalmus maximus]|uniref:Uncharacterized protein n=1 Tax=Scophthalmus maximus TaxID=52904 RepID=A0A6A4RWH3_SCOMX|nr:hypothetical protein F2P81_024350 [Scophthalmus maximus]
MVFLCRIEPTTARGCRHFQVTSGRKFQSQDSDVRGRFEASDCSVGAEEEKEEEVQCGGGCGLVIFGTGGNCGGCITWDSFQGFCKKERKENSAEGTSKREGEREDGTEQLLDADEREQEDVKKEEDKV